MKITDAWPYLAVHPSKSYPLRQLHSIDSVVVHHSAGAWRKDRDTLQQLKDYANYHVKSRGWPGIGYHYAIDPAGAVFKTNPLTRACYHAKGGNAHSVGVVLIGDFTSEPPAEKQWDALRLLLAELKRGLPGLRELKGHREVEGSSTACPGNRLTAAMLDELREALKT